MARRTTAGLIAVLLLAAPASACPTCRDSVNTRNDEAAAVAREQAGGFNAAIWTMLGGALFAAGGVSLTLFRRRTPDAGL